ncbi:hypothetical protein F5B20DRAFT_535020 [Whalleya microplaca]|nr:hypothetical protein F5B20DRAFT_535020 [Whalleya microplaca]
MPTGRGSSVPISPFRPGSSRSFNTESSLFGEATLQTPASSSAIAAARANFTSQGPKRKPMRRRWDWLGSGPSPGLQQELSEQNEDDEYAGLNDHHQIQPNSQNTQKANRNNEPVNDLPSGTTMPDPPNPSKDNLTGNTALNSNPKEGPPGEGPSQEDPPEEEPPQEKPAQEKPSQEKLSQGKPSQEKPSQEKPSQEKPSQEKPSQEVPLENETDNANGNATSETPTDGNSNKGLTEEEKLTIARLIGDMRAPTKRNRSPPAPIPPLDHLTLEEIRAVRALISDMGEDRYTVRRIVDELDSTAERLRKKEAEAPRPGPNGANGPQNTTLNNKTGNGKTRPAVNGNATNGNAKQNTVPVGANVPVAANGPAPPPPPPPAQPRSLFGRLAQSWNFWMRIIRYLGWLTKLSKGYFLILLLILLVISTVVQSIASQDGVGLPRWDIVKEAVGNWLPIGSAPDTGIDSLAPSKSAMEKLSKSAGLQPKVTESLKKDLPDVIHVEVDKDGRYKIPQDFWHALKEKIKADDIILTLETAKKEGAKISDQHWLAIKSRLDKAGLLSGPRSGADKPSDECEDCEQSWKNWLRQNEDALKKKITGIALTKDQFLDLFKVEVRSYLGPIRAELERLDARFKSLAEDLSQLRSSSVSPGGMTKEQVEALAIAAARKALEHAKLDAVAKGSIRGHAVDTFFNQVNFFAYGAGARIDPHSSSSPWKPPKDFFKSKKWYDRTYVAQPRMSALTAWSDEGECFCAGPNLKGYGQGTNNISVLTSRNIIPQHLVVEHILPSSTLDPGAMPKDIEVWAYIEEVTLREAVAGFSKQQFPDSPKEEVLNEGFFKIGQFVYENKDSGDSHGTQIFKISTELTTIKAVTNHIVVRAVSNYGADHTCFYRLKMYGEVVERPEGY